MIKMSNLNRFKPFLILLSSFSFWLWLFKDYFSGSIPINWDTNSNFLILKYFFNSVSQGSIPLWDPFTFLGRHFIYILTSCALNPFAWSIFLLNLLGLDYYQAYLIFISAYYFLGVLGFYYLLKIVVHDDKLAVLGMVLLLFSGLGPQVFKQIHMVYIFVPAVWFFVFWVRFFRDYRWLDFLGIILSSMILCISSFPFYFLTFFLVFNVFYALYFFKDWQIKCHNLEGFILKHKVLFVFGVCLVLLSATPLMLFKILDSRGEVISPERQHCETSGENGCSHKVELNYASIAYYGSLGERMPGGMLFSHLDKFSFSTDDFFYIPVLVYFIILISALVRFGRLQILILSVGLTVFLIALGGAAPMHAFLYNKIFYFKYFRNLFFYTAFLIPAAIFFAMIQFKAFLNEKNASFQTLWVVVAAGISLFFFYHCGNVLGVSYLTVVGAAVLFIIALKGFQAFFPKWALFFLCALAILEPGKVFSAYIDHVPGIQCQFPKSNSVLEFAFQRPREGEHEVALPIYYRQVYGSLRYLASFKDMPGVFGVMPNNLPDSLMRYTYELINQQMDPVLTHDTRHKLILYDQVPHDVSHALNIYQIARSGTIPEGNSQELLILKFKPNVLKLRTSFLKDKFLVYNDSYSSEWHVYIDGSEKQLFRANQAFKGVHVPAGEHDVEFRYSPPGGVWIYVLIISFMFLVLAVVLVFNIRSIQKDDHEV